MFLPFPWWKLGFLWLAGRQSRRPPGRGKALFQNSMRVSILGLALSVSALSLTLAIVSGFQKGLATSVSQTLGHVAHFTKWRNFSDFQAFVKSAPEGLKRVEAVWSSQALVVGSKGGRGVLIEGRRTLWPEAEFAKEETGAKVEEIRVHVGKALADHLGAQVGGTLKLLLPGILKNPVQVRIVELMDHGMYEIDSRLLWIDDRSLYAFLNREAPEELGKRPGDAHALRFFLEDDYSLSSHQQALKEWMKEYVKRVELLPLGEREPIVKSWEELRRNLFGAVGMDKLVLSVVLSLLTLVAALNVAATLVVLFLERDREIAVLQALGMGRWQVVQWVTIQGFLTGLVGAVLGLILAAGFALLLQRLPIAEIPADIYNLSRIPISFEWKEQMAIFFFGVFSAFIVSLMIACRLSKVNLVQLMGFRR